MADNEHNLNGWTFTTLRVFLIQKIDDLKDLMDQRQGNNEQAFHSALEAINRRHEMERRNLEDRISKTLDRINEIDKKLFAVSELKVDKREGLSSKYMYSAILFSALSFIIATLSIFYNFARSH